MKLVRLTDSARTSSNAIRDTRNSVNIEAEHIEVVVLMEKSILTVII